MTRKELRQARQNTTAGTGYICKKCEGPSPRGVGYATSQTPTYEVTACPCGWSVQP